MVEEKTASFDRKTEQKKKLNNKLRKINKEEEKWRQRMKGNKKKKYSCRWII